MEESTHQLCAPLAASLSRLLQFVLDVGGRVLDVGGEVASLVLDVGGRVPHFGDDDISLVHGEGVGEEGSIGGAESDDEEEDHHPPSLGCGSGHF